MRSSRASSVPVSLVPRSASAFRSSRASHSARSSVLPAILGIDNLPPSRPFLEREDLGYSTPIFPKNTVIGFAWSTSVFSLNLLLACLTTLILGVSKALWLRTLPYAPASAHRFLRRLPLSLAVFLLLLFLRSLLVPDAFAQGTVGAASPASVVGLYGLLFFIVAGLTNFVCNNLIAAEAPALEAVFLPASSRTARDHPSSWKRARAVILLFFLLYAVIGAHINASFSVLPVAEPGIAIVAFVTIIVAAYAKDGVRALLARRRHWRVWFEANALGLLLAVFSIWITRTLDLAPGYLFGVPAGVFIVARAYSEREGPFEWSGLLAMLATALVAWLLIPLAGGEPVAQDFLKLLVVILLEACFFESLPFTYLAGNALWRWQRWIWALQCTVATFLVLQLLWNPASTIGTLAASPPALTYVLLLGLYALSVLLLVVYCKSARTH